MRIPMRCKECCIQNLPSLNPTRSPFIELNDSGRYELVCDYGHSTIASLQIEKFKILYEVGAYAILDGYYREAVTSFTASLERFYEFFIRAKMLEEGHTIESISAMWNLVKSQSERQLGAFIFLYSQSFGSPPALLSNSKTTFRNEVVHKGKIPSRREALDYGEAILDVINPLHTQAHERFPKGIETLRESLLTPGEGYMIMPTILDGLESGMRSPGHRLIDGLEHIKSYRAHW